MADNIEVKVAEIDQRSKSNMHRLDKVEERQDNFDKLVASVEVLATKQETVEKDVKEIKEDVRTLAEKPGKRWDNMVWEIAKLLVVGAIGYFLAKLGFQ